MNGKIELDALIGPMESASIVHSLDFRPSHHFSTLQSLITMYDITYVRYADMHDPTGYIEQQAKAALERASGVMTISHDVKRDIVDHYRYPADRIGVVYPWISDELTGHDGMNSNDFKPDKVPYILSVGQIQPKKNLMAGLEAFGRLSGQIPHSYLIAGHTSANAVWLPYVSMLRSRTAELGLDDRVQFLGEVDDATLASLYRGADVLLFPSLHEGFGYPLAEAMHFSVPIVSSNTGSMPEVAGDAALLVPPTDLDAMTESLEAALTDGPTRTRLIAAGQERRQQFTKARAVASVLEIYRMLGA